MPGAEDLVALGAVTRAQGVRGQIRVKLFNPDSRILLGRLDAHFTRDGVTRVVTFREPPRAHQGDVLLWPVGCNDRDQAEAWRGHEISVPRSALPALPPGEYYHRDLIGMTVTQRDGSVLGRLIKVDTYPTVDVAVVDTAQGHFEVPIIDPYWVDADVRTGCVIVDHIEHLRSLTRPDD